VKQATSVLNNTLTVFDNQHRKYLAQYYLCATGAPLTIAKALCEQPSVLRWAALLDEELKQTGPKRLYCESATSPAQYGLAGHMAWMSLINYVPENGHAPLDRQHIDEPLRTAFAEIVEQVIIEARRFEISRSSMLRVLLVNSYRLQDAHGNLDRGYIKDQISSILERNSSAPAIEAEMKEFSQRVFFRAITRLEYDEGFDASVVKRQSLHACYSARKDSVIIDRNGELSEISAGDVEAAASKDDRLRSLFESGGRTWIHRFAIGH
jgi:hypothetical protein